ncbi:MAG: glycoside hydrolase family 3 protein [Treponema sp.]|nr:glycoside hydrolase family 3 protein [Treponema sp.]
MLTIVVIAAIDIIYDMYRFRPPGRFLKKPRICPPGRFFRFLVPLLGIACFVLGQSPGMAQLPGSARVPATDPFRVRAASIAAALDTDRLAAQLILSAVDGRETLPRKTRALLAEIPPGGIMLFRYNVNAGSDAAAALAGNISAAVQEASGIPPFIAADQEGGTVQRFGGAASLPPPLSYWERYGRGENRAGLLEEIAGAAERAGRELRRLGINLNLAPVAEPLYGGNGAFLKNRSYGPDVFFTGEAAAAFVRGMKRAGVAATLKHFPGNTALDPHRARVTITASGPELENMIFPFRKAAESGPAAVMLSHTAVIAWDGKPASLSVRAVRYLREDLGFDGIIIADDFSMAAIAGPPEQRSLEAVRAGVDMVMAWPGNVRAIHGALVSALEAGTLDRRRLEEAASRIIAEKFRYGLMP